MPYVIGTNLDSINRTKALSLCVQRYTGEHTPDWALKLIRNGEFCPLHFKDDNDWFHNTFFVVNEAGALDANEELYLSNPTYPHNVELQSF